MSQLTTDNVVQLTYEVWEALLAVDGRPQLEPGDLPSQDVVALASISGAWNGTVCLSCSRAAAVQASAAMFGIDEADVTDVELADAVGELVNVVGGNIKSLVPGPSSLSLPSVKSGEALELPANLQLQQEVRFSWMTEPVVVSIWSDEANEAGQANQH
ncbi:MAG: chemotaxis protein CheX [Acidimicrobiales bacterium]